MRKIIASLCALTVVSGAAFAADFHVGDAHVSAIFSLAEPNSISLRNQAGAPYSNIDTFTGTVVTNGGATAGITRLFADDLTPAANSGNADVTTFRFTMANLNTTAVAARPRVRFWFADGAAGAPGTYYNLPAAVGFSFNPITINANTVSVVTAIIGAGLFKMPNTRIWAGVTFDNVGTTTTNAQLNNLGQGVFAATPVTGSSADEIFATTAAGSFFNVANPAGTVGSLGAGAPYANFGWELVPEPSSLALLGALALMGLRRVR